MRIYNNYIENETEFEMRGLPALFKLIAATVASTANTVEFQEVRVEAYILAEDQGILDGMAGREIPVALAVNRQLANAWAYGYEIGRERHAASYGGLSEVVAMQIFCGRVGL